MRRLALPLLALLLLFLAAPFADPCDAAEGDCQPGCHFACLDAYDPAYAALKHTKLERLLEKEETNPDAQFEYQTRNLMAFAATEETPYDSSGRIVLPPMMRRKGGIGELALFLGTGETFQIWNPQTLLEDKRIPEDLKDIARYRLEERGVTP